MEIGISALYGNLSLPNPFTVMVSIYEFSLLYSFSHLSLSSQFWEFACCKNKKKNEPRIAVNDGYFDAW